MEQVFASQIEQNTLQFRDYILKKYGVSLDLYAIPLSEPNHFLFVAFLPKNNPSLIDILTEAKHFDPNNKSMQNSWEVGEINDAGTNNYALIFGKIFDNYPLSWQTIAPIKFTLFITLLCAIIYLFEAMGFENNIMQLLHYPDSPNQLHEWWRYFSPALVHLSWWHLSFNLLFWWLFAGVIERQCGTLKLIALFLCAAIISAICENYFTGPNFFGLSGVVYAVLGFVLILNKFFPSKFTLPDGFFTMLIVGLAMGFATPIIGIYTGNAAHISGFIVGILFALMQKRHVSN